MADILCTTEPQLTDIYFHYVVPTLYICSAIIASICTTVYISAYVQHKLEINPYIFGSAVLFFIVTLLNYVSWTIGVLTRCKYPSINDTFAPISANLYTLKGLILVGLLFRTVRAAFRGTPFAVTKCTVLCFRIPFVLSCVFVIAGFAAFFAMNSLKMNYMLGAASNLFSSGLSIYLVVLFIHKLVATYRSLEIATDNIKDEKLVRVITKISLLFSISTVTRILIPVVQATGSMFINVHFKLFVYVLVMVDLHTNFFCIFLCFQYFDAVYMKLCGLCDKCCRRCWTRCVHTGDEKMMMNVVEMKGTVVRVQSNSALSPPVTLKLDANVINKTETSEVSVRSSPEVASPSDEQQETCNVVSDLDAESPNV